MEFIDLDKKLSGSDSSYEKLPSDKKTKRNIISEILHFILAVAFVFAGAFLIVTFIAQRTQVNGSSMETTLSDKDNLIVEKISYHFIKPHRFDIVVFPHEVNGKNIYYIKRVIGLPGEKVQISNGVIYINDVALDEDYGCEVMSEASLQHRRLCLEMMSILCLEITEITALTAGKLVLLKKIQLLGGQYLGYGR